MGHNFLEIFKGLSIRPSNTPPSNPQNGYIYYDALTNNLLIYRNGNWQLLGGTGGTLLVDLMDTTTTTLPTTAPFIIDGVTLQNDQLVLFTNLSSGNNQIYKANISGSSITWMVQSIFANGNSSPSLGETIKIRYGNTHAFVDYIFNSNQWELLANYSIIGKAEDNNYSDGLFDDLMNRTTIGTVIDRFNTILKELSPQPPPPLSSIGINTTGVLAKISFDSTHPVTGYANVIGVGLNNNLNINGEFSNTDIQRKGCFYNFSNRIGLLADNITAGANNSYPAFAIKNGNKGILKIYVNDDITPKHSVDLSTFGSGLSLNSNNTGFQLSAATSILFPNGNPLNLFKYRTGTWQVGATDQRLGHNYIRVIHTVDSIDYETNYLEWIVDTDSTAITASAVNFVINNLSGSKYISGVQYYTSGTALYSVTLSNVYKYIYSPLSNAITFTSTSGVIPSKSIPNIVNDANDTVVINNELFTITANKLLNQPISVYVNCVHPTKPLFTGGSASINNILLYNINDPDTATSFKFNDETNRIINKIYNTQSDFASSAWDSTVPMLPGNTGYEDGLIFYDNTLRYPTNTTNSGNFSIITYAPAGNPDYSSASNIRTCLIKIINTSGSSRSNFKLNFAGSNVNFVSVNTPLTGNNIHLEMKFPNSTNGTGWMDCYADFITGEYNDGDGCRWASNGSGRALNTDWGITTGIKIIAVGQAIIIRITASNNWTGYIDTMNITWL